MSTSNPNRTDAQTGDERFEKNGFANKKNFGDDRGRVAELDQPARAAAAGSRAATSATFRMLPTHLIAGLMKLLWAGVSGGLGAFLLREMNNAPGLALNLVIIGGIGLAAAAILVALAYRDLAGRLTVNEEGVSLEPRWSGFHIAWKQVSSWHVTDEDELPPQMQQLKLWRKGTATPIVVDTSWLCVESRGTLRKVLRQVAGEDRLG